MALLNDIKKYSPLLAADGIYYLFTGLSAAVINKEVYAILSPRLISLQSIIGWGGGVLLGFMWSKWNKRLLPLMLPLFALQAMASILYFVYSEATLNMFIFWVLSMGMYIFFGGISDKIFEGAKAWFFKKSEERASYDNLIDMTGSIAGFLGYFISMIYVPSLRMAILFNFIATFFWCVGIIWYTIRHKSELKDNQGVPPTTGSDNSYGNPVIERQTVLGSIESQSSNGGEFTCYKYEGYHVLIPTCIGEEAFNAYIENGVLVFHTENYGDLGAGYTGTDRTILGLYIDDDAYITIGDNYVLMGNDMLDTYCPQTQQCTDGPKNYRLRIIYR